MKNIGNADSLLPRWYIVDGQWVKYEPDHRQLVNTDYIAVPYEVLSWNPDEGFTTYASNSDQATFQPTQALASPPLDTSTSYANRNCKSGTSSTVDR